MLQIQLVSDLQNNFSIYLNNKIFWHALEQGFANFFVLRPHFKKLTFVRPQYVQANFTLTFSYGKPRVCMKKLVTTTRNGNNNLKRINKIIKTDFI